MISVVNIGIRYRCEGRRETQKISAETVRDLYRLRLAMDISQVDGGQRVGLTIEPLAQIDLEEIYLECDPGINAADRIYCNGFQSWTDSREFDPSEGMKGLRRIVKLVKLHWFGDYHFHHYKRGRGRLHGYTYTYVRRAGGDFDLIGSMDERHGYTVFRWDAGKNRLYIHLECQGLAIRENRKIMDLLVLSGDEGAVFDTYFDSRGLRAKAPYCTGWTSWYNYYTDISEEVIVKNLRAFTENKVPIDMFQIDDGYQQAVGDWLDIKPDFHNGMGYIAWAIKNEGYKAGLWLAPFICESKSSIITKHPRWLLRDAKNRRVPAGWNPLWSGNFYALDIYNEEVRHYLKQVFSTVLHEWEFDMVKLDFLYAAAQIPRDGKTRGEIMCDAMAFLRECTGGRMILGCGVPLGAAFGLVDYCRIGSDVALKWEDSFLKRVRYRERVSTINSLTSTIGRRHLNGRTFLNDPDVFILRAENNRLDRDEKYSLFLLNNVFGGLLFCSDYISIYDKETMLLYRSMFPFQKKGTVRVREKASLYDISFTIGELSYRVFANLSGEPSEVALDGGWHYSREREERFLPEGTAVALGPHQSACFLSVPENAPSIAGSTGHLFPGSDVTRLKMDGRDIAIERDHRAMIPADIYVRVPSEGSYTVNGRPVRAEEIVDGFYTIVIERGRE